MPFVSSLPENATMEQVFQLFPEAYANWGPFTTSAMGRPDAELTPGEQELIASYASAVRGCTHCYTAHYPIAVAYGIDPDFFKMMMDDFENAPISEKMRPVLRYVKKLTREPEKVVQKDVDPIFEAGWSEQTLSDVVMICCLCAFANTLMMGHGADQTDMSELGPVAFLLRAKEVYDDKDGANVLRDDPEEVIAKSTERFGKEATEKAIKRAVELNLVDPSSWL